ncbi:MAG: hypothetical protein C0402_11255 [Thermodesulfovibrio sp.]|nr:hypothetical protein [Thermodesulfovibrio sp.]
MLKLIWLRRVVYKVLLLALSGLLLSSCNAVLGPPGSEPSLLQPGGAQFPHTAMFEGQPDMSAIRAGGGYYLWRNGNAWHVRVAKSDRFGFETPGKPTIYSGSIQVESGVIAGLQAHNTTLLSDVRLKQKTVVFRLELRNDIEGFDFSVRPFGPEYCLTFDLKRNREQRPEIVHLGRSMFVPETMPLVACVR